MSIPRYCRRIARVTGRHTYPQEALAAELTRSLQEVPDPSGRSRMVGFVYAQSGIQQRHIEADESVRGGDSHWIEVVNQATRSLARRTLDHLLEGNASGGHEVGALVVVTTSHIGFPSLSRRLVSELRLPATTLGFDVTGQGCAGPTHGLWLADSLLQAGHHHVWVLFVDTLATWASLRRFREAPTIEETVAHCLASDGAAALWLSREPGPAPVFGYTKCRLRSKQWANSLDQNDLTADAAGQPYLAVGKAIRTRLLEEVLPFLGPGFGEDPVFLHPGGPDLMKRLAHARPALSETIDVSCDVLRRHGNLGSASVLFVWDAARARGLSFSPRFSLFALGPGIVTTVLDVDGVEVPA